MGRAQQLLAIFIKGGKWVDVSISVHPCLYLRDIDGWPGWAWFGTMSLDRATYKLQCDSWGCRGGGGVKFVSGFGGIFEPLVSF